MNEAATIADWVIEHITMLNKIDRLLNKQATLTTVQQETLQNITTDLLNHKPVQYILNECWFAGMKLYVDENILIPRPETEELVEWIIEDCKINGVNSITIIDIGTGSGCIPIALKNSIPFCDAYAIDVSKEALAVAERNALANNTLVNFKQINFLDESEWKYLPMVDIIVSNPPYIAAKEIHSMEKNVTAYEPHLALFVADSNPLIFYEKIVEFALTKLHKQGKIFVEINEALGKDTVDLFEKYSFKCLLRKDLQGKDRMIKAEKMND
jgi:release factor glutamine methyltransferase